MSNFSSREVLPQVWISDFDSSRNVEQLKRRKITHLLALSRQDAALEDESFKGLEQLVINVEATTNADLLAHFTECADFISAGLDKGGHVLVFSRINDGRALGVLAAYVMKRDGLAVEEALAKLKGAKSISGELNATFLEQLRLFDKMGKTIDPECADYLKYSSSKGSSSSSKGDPSVSSDSKGKKAAKRLQSCYAMWKAKGKLNPSKLAGGAGEFACNNCSGELFGSDNVLAQNADLTRVEVEPMSWMGDLSAAKGALVCPHCGIQIGEYAWEPSPGSFRVTRATNLRGFAPFASPPTSPSTNSKKKRGAISPKENGAAGNADQSGDGETKPAKEKGGGRFTLRRALSRDKGMEREKEKEKEKESSGNNPLRKRKGSFYGTLKRFGRKEKDSDSNDNDANAEKDNEKKEKEGTVNGGDDDSNHHSNTKNSGGNEKPSNKKKDSEKPAKEKGKEKENPEINGDADGKSVLPIVRPSHDQEIRVDDEDDDELVDPAEAPKEEPRCMRGRLRGPDGEPEGDFITCLDEFPKDLKQVIKSSNIPAETLQQHFDIVLNIFYFHKRIQLEKRRLPKPAPIQAAVPGYRVLPEEELVDSTINPQKAFKLITMAGEGGYGRVYSAKANIKAIKGKVAIKRMEHVDEKDKRCNLQEINFLKFCNHPTIVGYYTSAIVKNEIWVAMEYMEGGTLTEAVKGHTFTEEQIAYCARELLKGLDYLHDRNLVHRDLKSANIMMTIKGQIKLIDFGLCVEISSGAKRDMVGSPFWMAPEMIQRKPHSFPVDIWSFAISLLELANKLPPFRKSSFTAMFKCATEGCTNPLKEPNKWSDTFKDFLARCLQIDPAQRATAKDLLQHPFMRKSCTDKQMAKILNTIFMHTAINQVLI